MTQWPPASVGRWLRTGSALPNGSLRCGWTVPAAPRLWRLSTGFAGLGVFRSSISPHAATYQHGARYGCACLRSIKVAQRAASKQVRQSGRPCNTATSRSYGVRNRVDGVRNRVDGMRNRVDGMRNRVDGMRNRVESPPEVSEWARQSLLLIEPQRKVRAPSDRAPGNAWGARAYGKCHRKQTAGLGR